MRGSQQECQPHQNQPALCCLCDAVDDCHRSIGGFLLRAMERVVVFGVFVVGEVEFDRLALNELLYVVAHTLRLRFIDERG